MLNVGPVVKLRQHSQQTQPANRSPTHELDVAIGGIGVGRDHHRAAGEFAVVERNKQAAPLIPIFVVVAAERKWAAIQLRYAYQDSKQISQVTERLEPPIRKRA